LKNREVGSTVNKKGEGTMSIFLGELIGTFVLILLGNGVVANVVLNKSKGQNSGWIVITTGWFLAVTMAVYITGWISGAHINPAVTIGLVAIGSTPISLVPSYLGGQFVGAFLGAVCVWLAYLPHWAETENPADKLACFSTAPGIRHTFSNALCEFIGTIMLVVGVLGIGIVHNHLTGGWSPFAVGLLVWSIGLSLGGPTGYAINPARDLGPRIAHALLPIAGKGDSDWEYAWIPVVAPIAGGVVGALLYTNFIGTLTPM
jgi:glycerol uptake facilitator protein